MSGKVKPRRVERKAIPPEESPAQTYKAKQMALGRPSGFVSTRPQRPVEVKKDAPKRNKLALLLRLNEKQPGLMGWTKAWKFSQPLPQPEQIPPASDWGQSWKFLNLQPNNESKSWMEHEHETNNNITHCVDLIPWKKADKTFFSQNFEEDIAIPDWERCWKYTNQKREAHGSEKFGLENLKQEKLHMLNQFHRYNEERSGWNEAWKSAKPPQEDHIKFTSQSVNKEESDMENNEQPTVPWGQSWKLFKRQFHLKSARTSVPPGWVDSWRTSKPVPQMWQHEKTSNISEPPTGLPEESLDPETYQTIIDTSKKEKSKMLWSSQFQGKDAPLPNTEWQKSWMNVKNQSEYKEQPVEKRREENTKLPEIQQVRHDGLPAFEVFSFPKKAKPVDMLWISDHKDKETFISKWKDSWKSLKNQRRQDRVQRRQQRISPMTQAAAPQASLTEWATSWRFTNLNVNQDSNLWQQGWSTYTRNRPDRWVRANEMLNEGLTRNGPTGARGWGESWRSTRHQHRAEREAARNTRPSAQAVDVRIPRRERSLADWEQSWQFSTNQFHHDRPSSTEWTDSWRFCSFHCENWAERQPEANQHEKSLEITARKEHHCPSHRFSRSFQPQTFKERFPAQEWKNSWKIKISEKAQPKSGQELPQSWRDSWRIRATQLYKSEGTGLSSTRGHSVAAEQYESVSEWGRMWKTVNPQPTKSVALWSEAQPNKCLPQCMVFCSRKKSNDYLFSLLAKDYASLRKWGKAWRFMKLESRLDLKSALSQSKPEDNSVIMSKKKKTKQLMFSQTDKEAAHVKRWADACKLAKTQPRPKRDAKRKPAQGSDEGDKAMFFKWAGSWRFVTDPVSDEQVNLTEWEDSWKFLLNTYAPQNGPKKTKGR